MTFLANPGLPGVLTCLYALSLTVSAPSIAEDVQFPKTIAWSAYPTGTGGYSQAVAIGNILQRQYSTNLRVIPGRNDVSRLATLRAERVHFSAGGSESVYAQEGVKFRLQNLGASAGSGDAVELLRCLFLQHCHRSRCQYQKHGRHEGQAHDFRAGRAVAE